LLVQSGLATFPDMSQALWRVTTVTITGAIQGPRYDVKWTGPAQTFNLESTLAPQVDVHPRTLPNDTQVQLQVGLFQNANTEIEVGVMPVGWDPISGVANVVTGRSTGTGGGLTPEQDQALTDIALNTVADQLVDSLTLTEHSPGFPVGGEVGGALGVPAFGIIVRIANVPPELVPNTPDGDYWVPSLAVVRVFRGSDLWMRVPIHTSNKIIPLLNEGIAAAVAKALTNTWMLNMTFQVTFREGVTGRVFTMNFP